MYVFGQNSFELCFSWSFRLQFYFIKHYFLHEALIFGSYFENISNLNVEIAMLRNKRGRAKRGKNCAQNKNFTINIAVKFSFQFPVSESKLSKGRMMNYESFLTPFCMGMFIALQIV